MSERKYQTVRVSGVEYQMVPPDGGWGCIVALATTVIYIATVVPMAGFGLIFQDFLKSLGDETSGAAVTNGLFNTVSFFMGIVANILLYRMSYRKVALLGSFFHLVGTVGTVFASTLIQLILFMGVFQGMGFGLLLPAALSAMNDYFHQRLSLWICISQTGMVLGYMAMPSLAAWSMQFFGFRGSLLCLAGLSMNTFPAALALQPVKRHMKLVPVTTVLELLPLSANETPLLEKRASASLEDTKKSFWQTTLNSVSLLKEPKYLNTCIGLALCFTADIAFYPIIPLILGNIGYEDSDVALMMSVYFGADLVARIAMSLISACVTYRSRKLFFWAALLSAIFRTVWLLNNTFWIKLATMTLLGMLRCFIETLVSLVVSEQYPDKFPSAFSLYMVANGFTCLICGYLMSTIKNYTHSDVIACQVLTGAFLVSVTTWGLEMYVFKKKSLTLNYILCFFFWKN